MAKITQISQPMGQMLRPIYLNQDDSINVTINFGFLVTNKETKEVSFLAQSQQNHHITAEESVAIFEAVPNDSETLNEALERTIMSVLRAKNAIAF